MRKSYNDYSYPTAIWNGQQVQYVCGLDFAIFDMNGEALYTLERTPENIAEIVRLLIEFGASKVDLLNAVG